MQTTSAWQRIVVVACCLTLTACMTVREVPVAQVQPPTQTRILKPGRKIMATLKDGSVRRFRLKAVDTEELTGQTGEHVAFADIATLKVERINPGATALAAVGAAAVVGVILIHQVGNDFKDALDGKD